MSESSELTLYEARRDGAHHGHVMRVVERSGEVYVQTNEPGGCNCQREIALSELVHLLANITEAELLTIPNRNTDELGHAHDAAPPTTPRTRPRLRVRRTTNR